MQSTQLVTAFFITAFSTATWTSFSTESRFQFYWNVPSEVCANTSTGPIRPRDYGIRANDGERFYGNEIVTFYEQRLGLYPKCAYKKLENGTYVIIGQINGGLPTADGLAVHLTQAAADIAAAMPDPNFSGLAIIDYEHWRPVFAHNWGPRSVYRTEATARVRHAHPHLHPVEAAALAEMQFNRDARIFFLETLRLGRRLRPAAKWGYYDFPLCEYKVDATRFEAHHRRCHDNYLQYNDKMIWLYKEVVALYPSIYFYAKPRNAIDLRVERNFVYAKIAESRRLATAVGRFLPTYLFSKNEYDEHAVKPKFYTKKSRCIAFGIPAFHGSLVDGRLASQNFSVQGVILWSTSKNMRARCAAIGKTMRRGLGKFLIEYYHRSNKCNRKLCNGYGRCVTRHPEFDDDDDLLPFICRHEPLANHMRCLCDAGRVGERCECPDTGSSVAAAAAAAAPPPPTFRPRRLYHIWRYRHNN